MTDEIRIYHVDDPNDAPERRLNVYPTINPYIPTSLPQYVIPPVASSLYTALHHCWLLAYQQGIAAQKHQQQQQQQQQQFSSSSNNNATANTPNSLSSSSFNHRNHHHHQLQNHLHHFHQNHRHQRLTQAASPSSSLGLTSSSLSSSSSSSSSTSSLASNLNITSSSNLNPNTLAASCSSGASSAGSLAASPVTSTTPASHHLNHHRDHNSRLDIDHNHHHHHHNHHQPQHHHHQQQQVVGQQQLQKKSIANHHDEDSLRNQIEDSDHEQDHDHDHDHEQHQKQQTQPHIKKPLNPFMIYMQKQRPEIVKQGLIKESAAINQMLGQQWRKLSKEEQEPYYKLAEQEKILHAQKYPGWSARDNYANQKKKKKMKLKNISLNGLDQSDKKCRARFGLNNMGSWCKPCKRKKKCIYNRPDRLFCH